jgi:lysophospholipase L1-like esterase
LANIPEAKLVDCTWLTAPHGGARLRGDAVTERCDRPVELTIPYPEGATVEVHIGSRRVARTLIQVEDLFIVGMGDSFAAGDGNPDIPVEFSRERSADYGDGMSGYPARVGNWRIVGDDAFIKGNAGWLDQACHRSLYSHQARAALQLAIEEPHRSVTYVGLACSGAETIFGLFLRYKGNEWVENPPELSQISAAAEAMCGKHRATPHDLPEAYHMRGRLSELQGLVLRKCDDRYARKIDLLFLSIGGNDIGFARLVANAVIADESLLKKLAGWVGGVYGTEQATAALRLLDDRYKSLNRALHNILHIPWGEADRIILTAYPGLALLGDGSAVCPDGTAGMEVIDDFTLSSSRAREGIWIADKLHHVMEDNAVRNGWTFAQSHRAGFIGRGICAGFSANAFSIADDLRLPRKINKAWVPYNPADYRAYASRQRWFRTPNDAFLTGNFHVSPSLLQRVLKFDTFSWFQLLLASTYSGAFHPTAEGQAAMADAVVKSARTVLARYSNKNPRMTLTEPM